MASERDDEGQGAAPAIAQAPRIDFGRTADDYRRYRAGFPPRLFDEMAARRWIAPGLRALDLGTGTGTLARGLAARGLVVSAIDVAAPLLEQASELDREAGVAVEYRVGRAEELDAPDGSFDLVTAGQCWHWFDRARASAELARVTRRGGRAVFAHFDWLPLPGNVVEATQQLIVRFNPAWSSNPGWTMGHAAGLYPQWLTDLALAGFGELETFSFDLDQPYTPEAWRGRIRASAGVSASLDEATVARFDAALAATLAERFPRDLIPVPHRVWAVSGRAKGTHTGAA